MKMKSHNAEAEMGTRGSASVSRWSPTKEQISILENLYKEGLRTPNADQIQRITCTLRAYGHIEGKNVFYWFQNHKARQRQKLKQKQQTVAYFNPFLHTSHPVSSSSLCQDVVSSPYCLQQSGICFYPQQLKMVAAGGISRKCDEVVPLGMPKIYDSLQIYEELQQRVIDSNFSSRNKETLILFPLHPTSVVEAKTTSQVPSLPSISVGATDTISDVNGNGPPRKQPFFDFLSSERRSRGSV